MKTNSLIATALMAGAAAPAVAQDTSNTTTNTTPAVPSLTLEPVSEAGYEGRRLGVGVMAGEPTGASLKYWISRQSALDAGLGWSFHDRSDFHLHADYLHHLFDLIPVEEGRLPVYFGGGLRVKFRDRADDLFGFRAVAGMSYQFADKPIDVFFEAGPVLDVAPDTKLRFTAAIGARYWF
jgi:hypothetical protein